MRGKRQLMQKKATAKRKLKPYQTEALTPKPHLKQKTIEYPLPLTHFLPHLLLQALNIKPLKPGVEPIKPLNPKPMTPKPESLNPKPISPSL